MKNEKLVTGKDLKENLSRAVFASLGASLAVAISWSVNGSILWAMLHGVFGWLYVIYYAIVR